MKKRPETHDGYAHDVFSLPSLVYFFVAWPFAALAVHLSDRDDAYLAFALVAGPLLVMAGIRLVRDPSDPWHRLVRALPRVLQSGLSPDSAAFRVLPATVFILLGLAFFGAGVVGAVTLLD